MIEADVETRELDEMLAEEDLALVNATPRRAGTPAPPRAPASIMTEGQASLQRLARRYTEKRVARRCGVSQPVVSRWISGKRRPNYENRKILLDEYQIPMDAWDRRIKHTP